MTLVESIEILSLPNFGMRGRGGSDVSKFPAAGRRRTTLSEILDRSSSAVDHGVGGRPVHGIERDYTTNRFCLEKKEAVYGFGHSCQSGQPINLLFNPSPSVSLPVNSPMERKRSPGVAASAFPLSVEALGQGKLTGLNVPLVRVPRPGECSPVLPRCRIREAYLALTAPNRANEQTSSAQDTYLSPRGEDKSRTLLQTQDARNKEESQVQKAFLVRPAFTRSSGLGERTNGSWACGLGFLSSRQELSQVALGSGAPFPSSAPEVSVRYKTKEYGPSDGTLQHTPAHKKTFGARPSVLLDDFIAGGCSPQPTGHRASGRPERQSPTFPGNSMGNYLWRGPTSSRYSDLARAPFPDLEAAGIVYIRPPHVMFAPNSPVIRHRPPRKLQSRLPSCDTNFTIAPRLSGNARLPTFDLCFRGSYHGSACAQDMGQVTRTGRKDRQTQAKFMAKSETITPKDAAPLCFEQSEWTRGFAAGRPHDQSRTFDSGECAGHIGSIARTRMQSPKDIVPKTDASWPMHPVLTDSSWFSTIPPSLFP
ncbi:uncharacterized protein CLUP02_03261 [Colletotrichum lupini]|uniref:Uncharacterized protein n=1 Tax=Colletotrichum lupini TaxID=145971 RepID=A0A9Q8SIH2_9PEZI|nr:uncharacterized protein CLUP02_03261 [Colletotrichum lupini]UQC77790.1 hypothetical protein CLUP02_03261 [Colletotrichum lupini]